MKGLCITLVLSFLLTGLYAVAVSSEEAGTLALTWYRIAGNQQLSASTQMKIVPQYNPVTPTLVDWFTITFDSGGFILIGADDVCKPVLAYSTDGIWKTDNLSPEVAWFLSDCHKQFTRMRNRPQSGMHERWAALRQNDFSCFSPNRNVEPMCHTTWNQLYPYNLMCPVDSISWDGHTPVGCVAVAMGQIMKYWAHPFEGYGSHSYHHFEYGDLSANFGDTNYNFSAMPYYLTETPNIYVSTLLYHCGVSIEMDYGGTSSGAYATLIPDALYEYFGYERTAGVAHRANYTDENWLGMIQSELDAERPVLYCGYDDYYGVGHAFVCDGYQGDDYLHINWGWGGLYDGYYDFMFLDPGSYAFDSYQLAVTGIKPIAEPVPPTNLCATLTGYNDVELFWTPPAQGTVNGYILYRNGSYLTDITNSFVNNYIDNELPPGTYTYNLEAIFHNGHSCLSNTASITIHPPAVQDFSDSFERCEVFGTSLPDWFTFDMDHEVTYEPDNTSFPHMGEPMSFISFNPSACTPPLTGISPQQGEKVAACFAPISGNNNDWLISPYWNTGGLALISFWARSVVPGHTEKIRVGYSSLVPGPQYMNIISGSQPLSVPQQWTHYQYYLVSNRYETMFIGIQCLSDNGAMLLIDNVKLCSTSVSGEDDCTVQPLSFSLSPNPFTDNTSFHITTTRSMPPQQILVYNSRGQKVSVIKTGRLTTGSNSVAWNGTDIAGKKLPSGIYYSQIIGDNASRPVKMLILH